MNYWDIAPLPGSQTILSLLISLNLFNISFGMAQLDP